LLFFYRFDNTLYVVKSFAFADTVKTFSGLQNFHYLLIKPKINKGERKNGKT